MHTTHTPQQGQPAHHTTEHDAPTGDVLSFDDGELELALKSVGCNARDLAQFLRSFRAQ